MGASQINAVNARAAADAISGMAWVEQSNQTGTLPDLVATCPAGTLMLTTAGTANIQRWSLEGVPAFLPPDVKGDNRILTREIQLDADPPIRLGSVLYAFNEHTYYYIVKPDAGTPAANWYRQALSPLGITQNSTNIKLLDSSAELQRQKLPASATSVIVVGFDADDTSSLTIPLSSGEVLYAINLHVASADFIRGAVTKNVALAGPYMQAGAIVSGRIDTFNCTKLVVIRRAQVLADIWRRRLINLSNEPTLSRCNGAQGFQTGISALNMGADPDAFWSNIVLNQAPTIRKVQHYLNVNECPVIA